VHFAKFGYWIRQFARFLKDVSRIIYFQNQQTSRYDFFQKSTRIDGDKSKYTTVYKICYFHGYRFYSFFSDECCLCFKLFKN